MKIRDRKLKKKKTCSSHLVWVAFDFLGAEEGKEKEPFFVCVLFSRTLRRGKNERFVLLFFTVVNLNIYILK